MLVQIVNKKRFKALAIFMAVNILAQIGFPSVAFALTSGPSQPEAASFEPINTNQMVDLFTGDFTYNIPLLNVPGPNGGYPINLAYHAGIGMEQEASWVGLGWNINPGAINRNLRGVPDDFSGDKIEKTVHMKPQRRMTFGVAAPVNIELLGFDALKGVNLSLSSSIYYDNYKGIGQNTGINLSTSAALGSAGAIQGSLGISMDSKEGIGVSPSLSYAGEIKGQAFQFETGLNYNSRQGLQEITFKANTVNLKGRSVSNALRESKEKAGNNPLKGTGVSFSASTYVPTMDMPRGTYSVDFDLKLGIDIFNVETSPINFFVKYSENKITQNTVSFGSYGLLYAQNNNNNTTLGDFNREKDIPVNKNSKSLPIPSATYDVFSITGQGTGGAFRTYRSDIGVFTDPKIETTSGGVGFGVESNILTPPPPVPWYIKTGFNPGLSVIKSYSGKWKNHDHAVTNYYKFKASTPDNLYEPAYFRSLGETVLTEPFEGGSQNNNEMPFRFEMGKTWDKITSVPKVKNIIETAAGSRAQLTTPASLSKRQTRVQSIEYLTRNDKRNELELYTSNSPNDITGYDPATPYYDPNKFHHIGEISVVNPDGNRYVYDLPAYNTAQEDVTFSVNGSSTSTERTRGYTGTENSTSNNSGLSNLYSKTATPAYAHSYLLTEVLSADYVDLTNDGPTDDDLGYWVKFNYIKRNNLFKWRAPYEENKGNNIEGKITNDMDDMSGYSYGEKEIVYLESIETKTHIAKFTLSQREDGLGVSGENGGVNTSDKLLQLDVITLYNKSAPSQPIKSVHFKYNYSLCPGTLNSAAVGGGKLTLTHVWFKYYKNTKKGELSPYEFTYGDVNHDGIQDPNANPSYNINKIDRWGNYQNQGPFKEFSTNNYLHPNFNHPYCNQFDDYTDRNTDASAWNLTKVVMPSGGALTIDYESDDYAYVQNKKAAQMYRIIGTGKADGIIGNNLTRDDQRIYIELDREVNATELAEYVSGIEQIYFKAYMKLKKPKDFPGGTTAVDYVEGYAKYGGSYGLYQPSGGVSSKAWIKVNNVPPHQVIQSTINPIKMAGLRELRYNRDDLVSGQNTGLAAVNSMMSIATVVPNLIGTVLSSLQMLGGFYNYGIIAGWCDEIEVNSNTYPSYIRLNNATGKKYGGGCRVKEIKLNDNWEELNNDNSLFKSSSYGQSYDYTLEDGKTSSGVAEYEPLVGGEENPFRQPVRFSNDRLIIKDNDLMIEEPFNENLFPSANVGYSRVTVRNIEQEHGGTKVKKAVSGIIVNEFYTARDFPVYTNKTGVDYKGYNLSIPIPFIGSYDHHNNGYSQGYSIELNNMHGKPYSVATYTIPISASDPKPGTPGVEPVAATFYHYKTQQPFVRNKPTGNKLSNKVAVLTGDAKVVDNVEIGKYIETYIDMRENKTNIISGDVQINNALNVYWIIVLGVFVPIPIPIPTVIPSISNSHSMFRSVATNKIITRNGILDNQVTTKEGARTMSQNIYYDARTGSPLLTTTTNDFDKPIYDYTYAAHWEHEGMRGAYQNVGTTVTNYTSPFVRPGDELIDLNASANPFGERYWVEENGTLKDKDGNTPSPIPSGPFKIVRSGYRNQQSVPTGSIISLSNPIAERKFPLFDEINIFTKSAPVPPDYILIGDLGFNDCLNNKPYSGIKITISPANGLIINSDLSDNKICGGGETNEAFIIFDASVDLTNPANFDVTTMILTKHGNEVKAVDGSGETIWGELLNAECLNECIDGVLHAGATKYSSSWNINYADAVPNSSLPLNTTRFGAENIWRTHQNFVFDIDRKQTNPSPAPLLISNTQTGIDGTYENFGLFNWLSSAPNEKWIKANQVNQYSPYGFELENQDALNIKSAAMYGYNNSVVTAVASNTDYRELAFDGFEDYNGLYGSISPLPTTPNYGHIKFGGTHQLVMTEAHTGNMSMEILNGDKATFTNPVGTSLLNTSFTPSVNEEYYFSSWVKLGANASATLTLTDGVNPIQILTSSSQQKIEGWQRLEGKFAIDATATTITIEIEADGGTIYLDDVRVQPFISNMKTFVYDPATLWLKAELDDRNYATIYSYDEEGSLVQIKKETKDGMRTIVSNRKNVKRKEVGIQP